MAKLGTSIARDLPPPDELDDEPAEGGGDADDKPEPSGDDELAAKLTAFDEFEHAESSEDKLAAFEQLLDILGYRKG